MTYTAKSNTGIKKKYREINTLLLSVPVYKKPAQLIKSIGLKFFL